MIRIMREPNLSGIDLKLPVVFDAIVTAGSVAGKAERLSLSPTAVSDAPGPLRTAFAAPLFVRRHIAEGPAHRCLRRIMMEEL